MWFINIHMNIINILISNDFHKYNEKKCYQLDKQLML
jgi:hypothetical protein